MKTKLFTALLALVTLPFFAQEIPTQQPTNVELVKHLKTIKSEIAQEITGIYRCMIKIAEQSKLDRTSVSFTFDFTYELLSSLHWFDESDQQRINTMVDLICNKMETFSKAREFANNNTKLKLVRQKNDHKLFQLTFTKMQKYYNDNEKVDGNWDFKNIDHTNFRSHEIMQAFTIYVSHLIFLNDLSEAIDCFNKTPIQQPTKDELLIHLKTVESKIAQEILHTYKLIDTKAEQSKLDQTSITFTWDFALKVFRTPAMSSQYHINTTVYLIYNKMKPCSKAIKLASQQTIALPQENAEELFQSIFTKLHNDYNENFNNNWNFKNINIEDFRKNDIVNDFFYEIGYVIFLTNVLKIIDAKTTELEAQL